MILKKFTTFLLLGIFLFNIGGYFIAFKVVQHQIKKEVKAEIKQGISTSQLTSIVIQKENLKQLAWKEYGKEFYHLGELYDIVKSNENGTSITYFCISDKQEELLFENLNEYIDENIAAKQSLKSRSSKKITGPSVKLYFNIPLSFNFKESDLQTVFIVTPVIYTSVYPEISSPPPEFI